ncbi:MAG: HAD hydrolase family protein [Coriobacteriales bacterium]|jgi:hydroxymethylpyrimidine pyrophosphatase-like HAD family hydrolase|nr:HAD hydrolase family protein [Coriobacteriales bacterium]
MQHLDSPAAEAALAQITHVYTDLDGTLLAPGGRMLANHRGAPSTSLAKALVRLKQAHIKIIIVTGRDAVSSTEILRLANLEQFIAEMGCVVQYGYGAGAEKSFNLGEWTAAHFDQDYDHTADRTPHELIARSGVVKMLLDCFRGRLEVHELMGSHREVTFLMRGNIDTRPGGEADRMLAQCELPLQLLDNGIIHPKNHGLLEVEDIHVYHLMPRGTGKGRAVAADMAAKGLASKHALAIGDAEGDVSMGEYTGSFVLVDNHKKPGPGAYAQATVRDPATLFTTTQPTIDGWVEFAHALLKAKHE